MSRPSLIALSLAVALVGPAGADGDVPATTTATATGPNVTAYHGFRIDTGRAGARIDDELPSLARQIAIVESVGLPADVIDFFHRVPIVVTRDIARPPGQFIARGTAGFVKVLPDGMDSDKPILLHELLHAYHDEVVGRRNAAIDAAYAKAKASSDYPARFRSAHFLENPFEYFAVTSTVYLFGTIQQPPFDCRVLAATQPEYLAFLASRFGPHDCR